MGIVRILSPSGGADLSVVDVTTGAQVLSPYTIVGANGLPIPGTMINRGAKTNHLP
ncbi:MAG: hypothetical protein ACERKN_14435 [Velocimicrobium sp.]